MCYAKGLNWYLTVVRDGSKEVGCNKFRLVGSTVNLFKYRNQEVASISKSFSIRAFSQMLMKNLETHLIKTELSYTNLGKT